MTAKTRKLVIVGDSAFAEIAREYFDADTGYEVVAFSVELPFLKRETLNGLPVLPFDLDGNGPDEAEHLSADSGDDLRLVLAAGRQPPVT